MFLTSFFHLKLRFYKFTSVHTPIALEGENSCSFSDFTLPRSGDTAAVNAY